jgi:hypothetical protein
MTNTRSWSLWFSTTLFTAVLVSGCVENDKDQPPPPAEPAPVVVPPEPPRAPLTVDPKATYTVATAAGNRCLQFGGGSRDDAAVAEVAACNGTRAQQMTLQAVPGNYFRIVSATSEKCLDIPAFSMAGGQRAQQFACNGGANQEWIIADGGGGTLRIVARHSGKVLDVAGAGDGAPVNQQDWKSAPSQQFKVKSTAEASGAGGASGGKDGAGGAPGRKSRKHAKPSP